MFTNERSPSGERFWLGVLLLAVGIAIGALARPLAWLGRTGAPAERELHPYLRPAPEQRPEPAGDLEVLELEIPEDSARVLQESRDRAIAMGLIIQREEDTVPAHLVHDGERCDVSVRIKGDWLDHVNSDQWSLRIRAKGGARVLGMSELSIQAPRTKGFLWEWFVLECARHEGLLAPRATFVDVVINGHPAGVYYLEEHFTKEMLESQGRRDGAIVRWDESTFWNVKLDSGGVGDPDARSAAPTVLKPGGETSNAVVRGFDEKRLSQVPSLARSLDAAVQKMHALEVLSIEKTRYADRASVLWEMERLAGTTVEELLNVDLVARAHALLSLFQVTHGLNWHNLRFYHDPLADRLEPVLFDNNVEHVADRDPVVFRTGGLFQELAGSRAYYDQLFRYLGELSEPGWLDGLFADIGDDLHRFEAALSRDEPLAPSTTVAGIRDRLRAQQAYLHRVVAPDDPINGEGVYLADAGDGAASGELVATLWSTSLAPVVVEGFRFPNGTLVPAAPHLVESPVPVSFDGEAGVVLPYDGADVSFRFPVDERLAGLESAQDMRRFARKESDDLTLDFDVLLVFRSIAVAETREEPLRFRPFDEAWRDEGGRPAAPTLSEALARHPFLDVALETGDLRVAPGEWDVQGDLVVPSGVPLHVHPGVTLRFAEGAVFVSDARIAVDGSPDAPVVLEPVAGATSWGGLHVLGAPERSELEHLVVRRAGAVERGGWVLTGGVTFHRSPVTLVDCAIEGSPAEDGLNVFGTDVVMERVRFTGCASDSFDGDFVTGRVFASTFRDGIGDGVDVSGSDLDVEECVFERLGDKAISAGEESFVRVKAPRIADVLIGIASKDGSRVVCEGGEIRRAESYALAAYRKKNAYGAASVRVTGTAIVEPGRGWGLADDWCNVIRDGERAPKQKLDVDELYRTGVLGR